MLKTSEFVYNSNDVMLQLDIDEYDIIYHYTSGIGFNSILFNDKDNITLWASRYDCLNDTTEGQVYLQIYKEVCNELLNDGSINIELYNRIKNLKAKNTELLFSKHTENNININYVSSYEVDRYVCSFTINSDSIPMWNYYSKGSINDGYNIGFFLGEINYNKDELYSAVNTKVYKVIYNRNKQKDIMKKFLNEIFLMYNDKKIDKSIGIANQNLFLLKKLKLLKKNGLENAIQTELTKFLLVFKSDYYEYEKECRVIVSIPKGTIEELKSQKVYDIKYRSNSGYIIPYIELKYPKYCFNSATIGIRNCNEEEKGIQREVVKEMLNKNAYKANVQSSEAPVRY